MSSLTKMWISFAAMGFMFLAILSIYVSRYKLNKGLFRFITAVIAYALLISSGLMMIYVVFSGPTG